MFSHTQLITFLLCFRPELKLARIYSQSFVWHFDHTCNGWDVTQFCPPLCYRMDVAILNMFLSPILTVTTIWNTVETGDIHVRYSNGPNMSRLQMVRFRNVIGTPEARSFKYWTCFGVRYSAPHCIWYLKCPFIESVSNLNLSWIWDKFRQFN